MTDKLLRITFIAVVLVSTTYFTLSRIRDELLLADLTHPPVESKLVLADFAQDEKSKRPPVLIHLVNGDNNQIDAMIGDCPVKWKFTPNVDEAHYHIHSTLAGASQVSKSDRHKSVLFSLESAAYYPLAAAEAARNAGYDLTMTYRLDSDIPIPYAYNPAAIFQPLDMKLKSTERMAAAFISNCGGSSNRLEIVEALQRYLRVDSFGGCAHNKDIPRDADGHMRNKVTVLKTYLFTLVFENSKEDYYVTEKYYDALEAGTIPVFLGTDKFVDWFTVTDQFYIRIDSLDDVKAAADKMLEISKDLTAYEKMFDWKKTKMVKPNFSWILGMRKLDERCRLAMLHWNMYNTGFFERSKLLEQQKPKQVEA